SFDLRPFGYWEERICSSWDVARGKGDLDSDLDRNWCLGFQVFLRFAENRDEFVKRLNDQVKETVIHWKAEAWARLANQLPVQVSSHLALQAVLETRASGFDGTTADSNSLLPSKHNVRFVQLSEEAKARISAKEAAANHYIEFRKKELQRRF